MVHVPGTSRKAVESSLTNSDEFGVFVQPDVSSEPESLDLQLDPVLDLTTGLCILTLSVARLRPEMPDQDHLNIQKDCMTTFNV